MEIKIQRTENPKEKPDESNLVFGRIFTDHMFIMDYEEGKDGMTRIVPWDVRGSAINVCIALRTGCIEGMKAYKGPDGRILLFRPDENMKRLNRSNERSVFRN